MGKTKLHPGARWIFRIRIYFFLIFFGIFFSFWFAGLFLAVTSGNVSLFVFPAVFLFFIVFVIGLGEVYARMSYNRWFYEFTENSLKIEKGIIWKQYKSIPYERIQNVDLRRGIIARILGFSTLDIQTAGYSGGYGRRGGYMSEGHIPAVSIEVGEKIREFLIKVISGKKAKGGL